MCYMAIHSTLNRFAIFGRMIFALCPKEFNSD